MKTVKRGEVADRFGLLALHRRTGKVWLLPLGALAAWYGLDACVENEAEELRTGYRMVLMLFFFPLTAVTGLLAWILDR